DTLLHDRDGGQERADDDEYGDDPSPGAGDRHAEERQERPEERAEGGSPQPDLSEHVVPDRTVGAGLAPGDEEEPDRDDDEADDAQPLRDVGGRPGLAEDDGEQPQDAA